MSALAYAMGDSMTMLRRNLRHALRYPGMTISSLAMPVVILLVFVYVFGGTLGDGLGAAGAGGDYIDFVAPGMILMAATSGAVATSVAVCVDMTEGIINRFRTMAISRASVLTGHVVGSVIQTLLSILIVIGVALALGFRPSAGPGEWAAAIGLLALTTVALTWLAAAFGLVTKSAEAASNASLPLSLLPFIGSAVVPTDSMPAGLAQFAEHQPLTPIIDTLRGLLMGMPIANSWWIAIAWCVGLTAVGYLGQGGLQPRPRALALVRPGGPSGGRGRRP